MNKLTSRLCVCGRVFLGTCVRVYATMSMITFDTKQWAENRGGKLTLTHLASASQTASEFSFPPRIFLHFPPRGVKAL